MWNFFKTEKILTEVFPTDIHSHLLAGLDDGVRSWQDTLAIIDVFHALGITAAVTTPHIMADTHPNTDAGIMAKLNELKVILNEKQINFKIEAAAEYYFDEFTLQMATQGIPFLNFGKRYVLFETQTFSEPLYLNEFIFHLKVKGYNPVMAHPERYQYLHNNMERVDDLINRGVYMQINAMSFTGFYSKSIEKMAKRLLENKMIHFLGSDCHSVKNAEELLKAVKSNPFKQALQLPLLNYSLHI